MNGVMIYVPYCLSESGLLVLANRLKEQFAQRGVPTDLLVGSDYVVSRTSWGRSSKAATLARERLLAAVERREVLLWFGFHHETHLAQEQLDLSQELRTEQRHRVFHLWERTGEAAVLPDEDMFDRLIASGTDGIIALNGGQVAMLRGRGVARSLIHLLSPAVDTRSEFTPPGSAIERAQIRNELGWGEDWVVGLYVGRMTPRKRVDLLINVWLEQSHLSENAMLVLVGAGLGRHTIWEDRVVGQASRSSRTVVIRHAGHTDRSRYYRSADFLILPSALEGEPSVLSEGMASGLPIIASAIPGHEYLVRHGFSGLLFAKDDAEGLRAAIERLSYDSSLRTNLGNNARSLVVDERDIELVAERYLQALKCCKSGVERTTIRENHRYSEPDLPVPG